jgi:ABC-type dipeptide/oligopeptide/nickel transport system permease component
MQAAHCQRQSWHTDALAHAFIAFGCAVPGFVLCLIVLLWLVMLAGALLCTPRCRTC